MPQKIFTNSHVLLTVIHARTPDQVEGNIKIAVHAGVGGVVLVDHMKEADDLDQCFKEARKKHPNLWIGVRFGKLDPASGSELDAMSVMGLSDVLRPNGIWFSDFDLFYFVSSTPEAKCSFEKIGIYFSPSALEAKSTFGNH